MKTIARLVLLSGVLVTLQSCGELDDFSGTPTPINNIQFADYSITPSYLELHSEFQDVKIYSILSSEDQLEETPEFVYGSMADGAGLLRNNDGTYTLINNIEADYSVARITFDRSFKPVAGDYILNATATANTAQCSGSLITPQEHGFGPYYMSGGEWGGDSKGVFLTNPYREASDAGSANMLPALGQWSTENAVALHRSAFPGQTVVLIGDDQGANDIPRGQLAMYVGRFGDLNNGKLYGLSVTSEDVVWEVDMKEGVAYDVEFIEFEERTLDELDQEAIDKGMMGFSRVEDIDWRRGRGNYREAYFAATGRRRPDLEGKGTIAGRVYKLELDRRNPLKGKITCVLDGDILDGKAAAMHSPDNITVTENYVYVQEDPNGYFDIPGKDHPATLWQYNIQTDELKAVLYCDQATASANGVGVDYLERSWELTGMIDISDIIGVPESFLIMTQNHGWEKEDGTPYTDPNANPDLENSRKEGSQLFVLKGLGI